jgi:hypothetical protein
LLGALRSRALTRAAMAEDFCPSILPRSSMEETKIRDQLAGYVAIKL